MKTTLEVFKEGLVSSGLEQKVVDGRVVLVEGEDFLFETHRHVDGGLPAKECISGIEQKVLDASSKVFEIEFISIERTKDPTIWRAVMPGGKYYPIDLYNLDDHGLLVELGLEEPDRKELFEEGSLDKF